MLPLRFPWLWMALGWLLVAGVAAGELVPARMISAIPVNDKLEHAGSYCLLMLWFAGMFDRRRHIPIAIILAVLGFTLDALQLTTATRDFDMRDVAANTVGILIGLALSLTLLGGWCRRVEKYLPA